MDGRTEDDGTNGGTDGRTEDDDETDDGTDVRTGGRRRRRTGGRDVLTIQFEVRPKMISLIDI